MSVRDWCGCDNVANGVVLQPVALVDYIVPIVYCVCNIKIDKESPILQTCNIRGNGVIEGNTNTNKAPLRVSRVAN